MSSVWTELKRRNVVKVAMAYAIVGWLLIEITSTVFPLVQLPEWTATFVAMLILVGFPIALLLSWAYELTPDGMKKTKAVPLTDSVTQATGRKIDFAIIGLMAIGIVFLVADNYLLVDSAYEAVVEAAVPVAEPVAETPVLVVVEEERAVMPNSVAVLLFDNLSPNPDDAYFAAGLHDEILNQLNKLSSLSVISRTSVLRYEDSDLSIPEIARELNVGTVMEGSVRYANDQVRITTQLIDAATDEHLWSETYDREFADIFAIESDIAMNIANALEAEFSLEEQARIEAVPTESSEAYAFYLKALEFPDDWHELLSQAITLDPNFTLAYAFRGRSTANGLNIFVGNQSDYESRRAEQERLALEDIARALELDPNFSVAHAALGRIHAYNWRGQEARHSYERALELGPNNPIILSNAAQFYAWTDQFEEALRLSRRALELDPSSVSHRAAVANNLRQTGDIEAAESLYQAILETNPRQSNARNQLARFAYNRGDIEEVERHTRVLESIRGDNNLAPIAGLANNYAEFGLHDDAARVLERFDRLAIEAHVAAISWVDASLARGDEQEALRWLRIAAQDREPYAAFNRQLGIKRNARQNPILEKPEFVELRQQLGFTDL